MNRAERRARSSGSTLLHCHKVVAEVAKAAAAELYEHWMFDNQVFEQWKSANPGADAKELEKRFVRKFWPKCIPHARATMALLLRDPTIPPLTKEAILDALVLDRTLVRGRTGTQIIGSTG